MTIVSSEKLDATDEPRWGMWTSLVTAWLLPATTATRTQHLPLGRAFVAHLFAVALSLILIVIVTICDHPYASFHMSISYVGTMLREILGSLVLDLYRDPLGTIFALLRHGVVIEVGFLALAVLVMPWGARDERIGATIRHTLRRVWLQSAHGIPIVLLVGGFAVGLASAERAWWRKNGAPSWSQMMPRAPELTPSDPGYTDAKRKYDAAASEYRYKYLKHRQDIAAWFRAIPWFVDSPPGMIPSAGLLAALWWLWALVRALGADRAYLPFARGSTCDRCGYSLAGMSMVSRCPECGEPVVESLGPDTRPGTVWERRADVGRLRAWWRCFLGTLFRPEHFGQQLRIVSPNSDYRHFFTLHLPLIFCFGAAGFLALGLAKATIAVDVRSPTLFVFTTGVIFGCSAVITAVFLAGLAALMGSAWHGFHGRRNLMPGAIQVACYMSGCLTLCFVFAAGSGTAVVSLYYSGFYAEWVRTYRADEGFPAFLSWLVPNMVCLLVYFVLVVRGTAAIRYANR